MLFFDEASFSMGASDRRAWWGKNEMGVVRLRSPALSIKLSIIRVEKVIAFQISSSKHWQEDVELLLGTALLKSKQIGRSEDPPYLVLDNGPKNRGKGLRWLAEKGLMTPVYITSESPDQNLAENYFWWAKKNFAEFRNLAAINTAEGGASAVIEALLSSLAQISSNKHINC